MATSTYFGSTDAAPNTDAFAYVYQVNYDEGSHIITAPVLISTVGQESAPITATMSDSKTATDITTNSISNNLEGAGEAVYLSGDFRAYLDSLYKVGGGSWNSVYTGYSTSSAVSSSDIPAGGYGIDPTIGLDQPIITINYFDAAGDQISSAYYVLSNESTLPIDGSVAVEGGYYYSCFEKNTLITTPAGDVVVSELKIGDKVLTQDGRAVDIKWIGYQAINAFFAKKHDSMPIKIAAGALGDDLPRNDLYVSPDHAFLIDGLLVNASALVNGESISQLQAWAGNVEYYHIETEDHEMILAEGVPAETLLDNSGREKFANYKEFQELYPQGKVTKELDFPRVKFPRQLPEQIKKKLSAYQGNVEMAA